MEGKRARNRALLICIGLAGAVFINGCGEPRPPSQKVRAEQDTQPRKDTESKTATATDTNNQSQSNGSNLGFGQTTTINNDTFANKNVMQLAAPATAPLEAPWQGQDQNLTSLARALVPGGNVAINALVEIPMPCPGGGTQTQATDNVPPPWFSEGDTSRTVYTDCINGNTMINGEQGFTVDVLVGQPYIDPDWNSKSTIRRDITRTDLTTGNVTTATGSAAEQMIVTGNTAHEQVLSGENTRTWLNNGEPQTSTENYSVTFVWDETTQEYRWDFNVSAGNTLFGDTTAATIQTLTGVLKSAPETGQFETTKTVGDVTSTSTITAIGGGDVQVETDADGDGIVDSTSTMNWNELMLDPILYQFI